jgi:hypothetical protein
MRSRHSLDSHLKALVFSGLDGRSADAVTSAIRRSENFHGYIPSESLDFIVRNYRALASLGALEAAWLDAYVHASHFAAHPLETLKAIFDACDPRRLQHLKPVGDLGALSQNERVTLFRGCAGPRHTLGMSWTQSLDKAIWYAAHHVAHYDLSNPKVYVATISIESIYCRLDHYDGDFIALPDEAWPVAVPSANARPSKRPQSVRPSPRG